MKTVFLILTLTLLSTVRPTEPQSSVAPVISGSRQQNDLEKSHIDHATGKVKRNRIVRKKNFLFLNLKNIDKGIKNSEFLVLFVFGQWCTFAKKHLKEFRKLATFHASLHSKLLFGKLHIARKEQFIYSDIKSNPSVLLFHRGHLLEQISFLNSNTRIVELRPRILNAFRVYLIHDVASEGHLRGMLKSYERFLLFVNDGPLDERGLLAEISYQNENEGIRKVQESTDAQERELIKEIADIGSQEPVIGIESEADQKKSLEQAKPDPKSPQEVSTFANYLKMADMRFGLHVKYFSSHSLAALQGMFPEVDVQSGHVYLFRQKDHSLMRLGLLDMHHPSNWFDIKNWLYHHINPHVLAFPSPAREQIVKNHNLALMLFMPGTEENLSEVQTANETAELELDIAAKELYK